MLNSKNIHKLLDISKRTISINREILKEEENYLNALYNNFPAEYLESCKERIRALIRKEVLLAGAAHNLLKITTEG